LPATELKEDCYSGMFWGCESLTAAPSLPSKVMSPGCYRNMFNRCISLVNAPALPSMNLEYRCYSDMFRDCTSLRIAPELPATTLKKSCYLYMFSGCTSLVKSPVLPAQIVLNKSNESMFSGCSSLSYVKAMLLEFTGDGTTNWLSGVSEKGLFIKNSSLKTDDSFGPSSIPKDWDINVGTYNPAESEYEETGTVTPSGSSSSSGSVGYTGTTSQKNKVKPYYHVISCEINSSMS
jgi:hypothetical protein